MIFDLANDKVKQHILQAEFGLERESLRVIVDGTLAQTKHPFPGHRNIDRDFCENQIEIIGDVFNEPEPMNAQLNRLQDEIDSQLIKDGEVLWAFSNPPKISGEDEIPVAEFGGSQRGKSEYRNYLAAKYGKKKMLFSGIHLNFSFAEPLLRASFEQSGEHDFQEYKNDLYLKLARRLTQYAWLVVYLTAASPVLDESFGIESGKYSSVRCSELGYWNTFTPILDYTDLRRRLREGGVLSDDDWREMERQIRAVWPDFVRRLSELVRLSEVEWRTCLLIRLKLSPSDMTRALCREASSISSIRSRLYAKVFGTKGSPRDWDDFILSL